jgi:uncharacterized membrane protein
VTGRNFFALGLVALAKILGLTGVIMGFSQEMYNLGFGLVIAALACVVSSISLCLYSMYHDSASKKQKRVLRLVENLGLDQATAMKVVNID